MWTGYVFVFISLLCLVRAEDGDEEEEEEDSAPKPPPMELKSMETLVKDFGYSVEAFDVKSSDGYISTMFHIPAKNPGGPAVLLQHPMITSADAWALTNKSLAYLLSDQGNDVWLASSRGSVYGRKHEKYSPDKDEEFWNFSWEEMGLFDLPAAIDFVIEKTKQPKIYAIAHSTGTSSFFALLSKNPEYNDKLKLLVALGPIAYAHKYQFMLKPDSSMYGMLVDTLKQFDEDKKWEAFPRVDVVKTEHQITCPDMPEMVGQYCTMGIEMVKAAVGDFVPAGASLKSLKHYVQAFEFGQIRSYDYGKEENLKRYQQESPPNFDFKLIKVPVYIMYSTSDQMVDVPDVELLLADLQGTVDKYLVPNENFNHFDYIYASSEEVETSFHDVSLKIASLVKA